MSIFERLRKPEKGHTEIPSFEEAMKNMPKNPTNFTIPPELKAETPKETPEEVASETYDIHPVDLAEAPIDASPEQLAAMKRERVERKIIGTLLSGDLDLLHAEDLSVDENLRQVFYEKIRKKQIALKQEYEVVKCVYPNYMEHGTSLFRRIQMSGSSPLQLGILGYMTEGPTSLKKWRDVDSNNFFDFTMKYKDAVSFDQPATDFVEMLYAVQSPQAESYARSMEHFKKTMYGEQQEYLDAVKRLNAEANTYFETKESE